MASKKDILAEVLEICEKHNASKNLIAELTLALEPKKGGASLNIDDVFVANAKDGKAYLLCSVSGLWMEATADNFYEDLVNENNKFGGLKRLSRAAEAARKKAIQVKKATEKSVMEDLLAGNITAEAGKEIIAAVAGPDYSSIEGLSTKPE
jgi:hypothetical protein